MIYTQDIGPALSDAIGEHGADPGALKAMLAEAAAAVNVLRTHREDGSWPVLTLTSHSDDLDAIEKIGAHIKDHFATLIVIGMGGSSRGGKTLVALQEHLPASVDGTQVYFIENIDPHTAQHVLAAVDLETTLFLIISKSGDTAETLAHALIYLQAVEKELGAKALARHFIAITEPRDNALTRIAAAHNIPTLMHDPGIGGRFAALTLVGLLPAFVAGVDIRAVRKGAHDVVEQCFEKDSAPAIGAALQSVLRTRGKTISVLMPYCDRLEPFTAWHQQIWAESLGKDGIGLTPLRSLGATDQHSILQLYLDGPRDKFFTLITLTQEGRGPRITAPLDASLAYLQGRTIGDLMAAEQHATIQALTQKHCPLRHITLGALNEEALGALMMHFMLETMLSAVLMRVNAFDQPAVETGKKLARDYLLRAQ